MCAVKDTALHFIIGQNKEHSGVHMLGALRGMSPTHTNLSVHKKVWE